jgi:YgiT-type zinc finger domain-containing protein
LGITKFLKIEKNHVVLVRDVPCDKCNQCGETYFSSTTVQVLENVLNEVQSISSEITLSIINYEKRVA